jgi:4-diphosphocytidyl-2-C-methyl-D-erythritol kinase
MEVTRRTPAKVNLCLLVGPKDATGYHELFTIFAPVDLYDTLDFSLDVRPQAGRAARLAVECGSLPAADNLVTKALRALETHTGWVFSGRVVVHKRIPIGGGMGGGSSDGAAALLAGVEALAAAGGPVPDRAQLLGLARGLGADVPFFLDPTPSVGRGIGEILEPIALPPLPMVLVFSERTLSTARVYGMLDALRPDESRSYFDFRSSQAEKRWRQVQDVAQAARLLENDLEQASFSLVPSLAVDREVVVQEGAMRALMSGSGPTLFGLCESVEKAEGLHERLEARGLSSRMAVATGTAGR